MVINFFSESEEYGFLSNFWKLETPINYQGCSFETSEHLYHALKFIYAGAPEINDEMVSAISDVTTAYKSKCLANYCNLRKNFTRFSWQKKLDQQGTDLYNRGVRINPALDDPINKLTIMRIALKSKFSQSDELRLKLLATGEQSLVENSPYDSFWGTGSGDGSNWLGVLLMELRTELKMNE